MARPHTTDSDRPRHAGRNHAPFAPVVWIVVLLASWLLIVEWQALPDLANAGHGSAALISRPAGPQRRGPGAPPIAPGSPVPDPARPVPR